jgi:PST family polysaccharide transporter
LFEIKKYIEPHKTLVKNFTSLSLLQISNYLFPLITLPYLVRVLGPEKFGLVNFAMAFITYFVTICDYGFNLSVTKQIAVNRDNQEKINEIFSSVISSKIILGILSVFILVVIIFNIEKFSKDASIYLLSFGIVAGNILFPIWFYQGIEDMKFITLITFGARFVGTILIFLFINNATDYKILVIIYSLVSILIGVSGFFISIIKFNISLFIPEFESIRFQFKEGLQIFVSTLSINLYTTTNIFLLGILVNDTAVGYFTAADKIRMAVQNILPTITQTVFPHINKLLSESFEKFLSFIKYLLKYQTIISFLISLILYLFAEQIVEIVLGNKYPQSIPVLKILSLLPLLSSFTTIFSVNILLPMNLKNDFMKTFLAAGIISLVAAFILVPVLAETGTAIAFIIAEITAASFSFWFVNRKIKLVTYKWI